MEAVSKLEKNTTEAGRDRADPAAKENKKRVGLLRLFWIHFSISAFTFGGGYVVIPMIRKHFVCRERAFSEEDLLEMAAISQSAPGAIAVNLAVLSGYRVRGTVGALVSAAASVLPPLLILGVVSGCYELFREQALVNAVLKGMEAGVAAVIVELVGQMGVGIWKEKDRFQSILAAGAFLCSFLLQVNVALIVLTCAGICCIRDLRAGRRQAQQGMEGSES